MTDLTPLTVYEINSRIKAVLEGALPPLWVRGEISQFLQHRSGHWYFTITDERSQLYCVLWRGRTDNVAFVPQMGQLILVQGKITVYERGGRYQFDCFEIRPAGVGDLAQAFEALKRKLDAEGLFAIERKVPLPALPERVGLVTSPDGAALQDMLRVARERAPWVEFMLAPAAVQGSMAAREISEGIRALDKSGWADIVIIGRGGGAPEDLWAFNEEVVVRSVAECKTPIVSAVGHEVDVTLADLAADLRAPTPSAAVEMSLPDRETITDRLQDIRLRILGIVGSKIRQQRSWLTDYAATILRQRVPALWREETQKTDELFKRLDSAGSLLLERRRSRFDRIVAQHKSLDPIGILSRGYSVVRKAGQKKPVTSSGELDIKESIDIAFHHGSAQAVVKSCQS